MRSPLLAFVLSALLLAMFAMALIYGVRLHSEWTLWAVVISGALWGIGAMFPVWQRGDVIVNAVFNSSAASAAVFAGLTALTSDQVAAAMKLLHR
jgi:hypothetical protein